MNVGANAVAIHQRGGGMDKERRSLSGSDGLCFLRALAQRCS